MRWRGTARTLSVSLALAMLLNLGGVAPSWAAPKTTKPSSAKLAGKISEASPPDVIQQLRESLEKYQPQVAIASPKSNEVLQDNTVSVQLRVKDLPLFKDAKLGLGPHLHVFLDNQPYQAVYDVSQPLVLKDLAPGTHTLRVFAGRPWHESFKNDGAYAQTTFHVFTKTPNNDPNPGLPLLTYSRPQGVYGAEPIMLDFYLTNAPLHLVAQEDAKDEVVDWRIRVTVNGDSFLLDRWQPIYLKGFKPGKNWVQLEYIDEKGQAIQNVFNNTARIFTYEPNGKDALAKLTRGELSLEQARGIVDPNYKPGVIETPEPEVKPEPSPVPVVPIPKIEEKEEAPKVEEKTPEMTPIETAPEVKEKPKGGFFNRFKRSEPEPTPSVAPSPEPEKEPETIAPPPVPVVPIPKIEEKEAAPKIEEKEPETVPTPIETAPEIKEKPKGGFFNRFKRSEPETVPSPEPTETVKEPETIAPTITAPEEPETITPKTEETPAVKETPKGGFFNRFKRPAPAPSISPSSAPIPTELPAEELEKVEEPEIIAPEVKEPPKAPSFNQFKPSIPAPSVAPSPIPSELPIVEPEEAKEPKVITPEAKETPEVKAEPKGGFFDRFKKSTPKPAIAPTPEPEEAKEPETSEVEVAPEVKETPKAPLFDQFKRSTPKPVPSPTPEIEEELKAPEEPEVIVPEVKETPAAKETPKDGFFNRFQRPNVAPTVAPSPIPNELAEPATPEKIEVEEKSEAPEVVAPVVKPTPKVGVFDRFQRPLPKPTIPPVLDQIAKPEEKEPEVKETPKAPFFNRFQREQPTVSAPRNAERTAPPAPSVEMIEPPMVQDKSEEPEIETKPTPKPDFFKRFQRPEVKPTETPDRLSVPEAAIEEPKLPEPEPSKPEPKENPLDQLRRSAVKSLTPPAIEAPETPEDPNFDPRSELERRLGVPIKPPIPSPEKPTGVFREVKPASETPKPSVKFEVPKSSELFKRKVTNPFLQSSQSAEETPEPAPTE